MSRITPRASKNHKLNVNKCLSSQSTYEISYCNDESDEKVEEIILVSIDRSNQIKTSVQVLADVKYRYDSFGTIIQKGQKNHKIKFSQELCQIKIIENWKDINRELFNREEEEITCPCRLM